jgi:hypothetical protein
MKYIFPTIQAITGAIGLRYSHKWPFEFTGADSTVILILSAFVLISALSKINQLINKK